MGRFISEDPLAFGGGTNFYAYTLNNPVRFSDPSGLLKVDWSGVRYHGLDDVFNECFGGSPFGCTRNPNVKIGFKCKGKCGSYRVTFTVKGSADIFYYKGPLPPPTLPPDMHPVDPVNSTADIINHERNHLAGPVGLVVMILSPLESQSFGSRAECEYAARAANGVAGSLITLDENTQRSQNLACELRALYAVYDHLVSEYGSPPGEKTLARMVSLPVGTVKRYLRILFGTSLPIIDLLEKGRITASTAYQLSLRGAIIQKQAEVWLAEHPDKRLTLQALGEFTRTATHANVQSLPAELFEQPRPVRVGYRVMVDNANPSIAARFVTFDKDEAMEAAGQLVAIEVRL